MPERPVLTFGAGRCAPGLVETPNLRALGRSHVNPGQTGIGGPRSGRFGSVYLQALHGRGLVRRIEIDGGPHVRLRDRGSRRNDGADFAPIRI
jgi:hypothetical protein